MTDPQTYIASLRRPRLLVRAARLGLADYNRDRWLRRLMPGEATPRPGQAFHALAEREDIMNQSRLNGDAAYSVARHIELLIALIDESKLAESRMPKAA
ncbi:DUF6477 family protein [Rhodobacteraceae bacterium]|nr:DUF6477 family protein [Paracoccaceae bacterium]